MSHDTGLVPTYNHSIVGTASMLSARNMIQNLKYNTISGLPPAFETTDKPRAMSPIKTNLG